MCIRDRNNISWERLEKEGAVCYPVDDETSFGNEILFSEGFPTSNGKAKIVPADLMPPDEKPNKKFPFILTTGRLLEHWHTGAMTRRSAMLEAQEPTPTVSMNPKDIRKLGLKRGEKVLVETQRGIIEILLREDRDVSKGMLFIPFCFTESPANKLTNPHLDPFGKIPEFKYAAARIYKAN